MTNNVLLISNVTVVWNKRIVFLSENVIKTSPYRVQSKSSAVTITAKGKKFVKAELIKSPSYRHGLLPRYLLFLLAGDMLAGSDRTPAQTQALLPLPPWGMAPQSPLECRLWQEPAGRLGLAGAPSTAIR